MNAVKAKCFYPLRLYVSLSIKFHPKTHHNNTTGYHIKNIKKQLTIIMLAIHIYSLYLQEALSYSFGLVPNIKGIKDLVKVVSWKVQIIIGNNYYKKDGKFYATTPLSVCT